MPGGLFNVEYNINGGKTHHYQFAVKEIRGGSSAQPIDNTFIQGVIGPRLPAGDYANLNIGSDPTLMVPAEAILNFLKHLHPTQVTFTKIYLSDGATPGPSTGQYAVTTINVPGTWLRNNGGNPNSEEIAPGTNTLLLGKTPALLGIRAGHLWLRYVARDNVFTYGPDDTVSFNSAGTKAIYNTIINNSVIASGLASYFIGQIVGSGLFQVGQAQFYSDAEVAANPALKNALKVVQTIRSMILIDAQNRQAKRGRKRAISQAQAIARLQQNGVVLNEAQLAILELQAPPLNTSVFPGEETYPDEIEGQNMAQAFPQPIPDEADVEDAVGPLAPEV